MRREPSDFYGPYVTNQLIREALKPYPLDLVIVTKIGALRDDDGSIRAAVTPKELGQAVRDSLRNLGVERLDVVNFRVMIDEYSPSEGSIGESFTALAELQHQGLMHHLGISLLQRSPNILLIPGTASVQHLRENLQAARLELPTDAFQRLDAIAGPSR